MDILICIRAHSVAPLSPAGDTRERFFPTHGRVQLINGYDEGPRRSVSERCSKYADRRNPRILLKLALATISSWDLHQCPVYNLCKRPTASAQKGKYVCRQLVPTRAVTSETHLQHTAQRRQQKRNTNDEFANTVHRRDSFKCMPV